MTKHTMNLRSELTSPEVQKFEKTYSESIGRQVALRDIPLKNFVDTTSGLLETKISQTFMKGASDAAGYWPELIKAVEMTSPQQSVPIISQRDFKVRKGRISGTAREGSGGKFTSVKLDATDDEKRRYVYFNIDREDVKMRNFDLVEAAVMAAGAAFAKNILDDVMSFYDSINGETQALSTDKRFVAVAKLLQKMAADGFDASAIVFDSGDFVKALTEETAGGTMPWLLGIPVGQPLGDNFGKGVFNGFVGDYMSKVPVYSIANTANGAGAGEIFAIDRDAAAVLGWAPGGQIELLQEVKKLDDLIANAIQAKYDIAAPTANKNAVGVVTGASA